LSSNNELKGIILFYLSTEYHKNKSPAANVPPAALERLFPALSTIFKRFIGYLALLIINY